MFKIVNGYVVPLDACQCHHWQFGSNSDTYCNAINTSSNFQQLMGSLKFCVLFLNRLLENVCSKNKLENDAQNLPKSKQVSKQFIRFF